MATAKKKKKTKVKKVATKSKAVKKATKSVAESKPQPAQTPQPKQQTSDQNQLSIKLSETLIKKIKSQAGEEGISVSEYAGELLSEGVVLRAWEILERRQHMRSQPGMGNGMSGNSNGNFNGNRGNNNNNRRGDRYNNNNNRRMSNNRYNNIMDDKANFLEYVRNQEKQSR